jgi:hypothetical protein
VPSRSEKTVLFAGNEAQVASWVALFAGVRPELDNLANDAGVRVDQFSPQVKD